MRKKSKEEQSSSMETGKEKAGETKASDKATLMLCTILEELSRKSERGRLGKEKEVGGTEKA